ncbi:hypothetical protein [Modicisalibacter radicis]|uniref:hypothetical protein n=1 Tax=Halomonas sp. EAR18 TaxID=2518972 RepID=UPI001B34A886|nr:hypothetical protein [Halomonas sp. EAR18]
MLKRLLLIVALVPVVFVSIGVDTAHAEWSQQCGATASNSRPSKSATLADVRSWVDSCVNHSRWEGYSWYEDVSFIVYGTEDPYYKAILKVYFWQPKASDIPSSAFPDAPVFDHIYTDEQCQAQYGHATVLKGEFEAPPYDQGACSLTPSGKGVGVCTKTNANGDTAPAGQCYLTGDFDATSTGEVNDTDSNVEPSDDLPDYLTETDDPATCSGGYVGSGGSYYCYDGGANLNVGAFDAEGNPITLGEEGAWDSDGNPIELTEGAFDADGNPIETGGGLSIGGGSWGDPGGGDSGGDSGGGSGSGGGIDWGDDADEPTGSTDENGDPLGQGDGEGDSTLGDVVGAINKLKTTVRNGFDGIVDKFTSTDGAPDESDIRGDFDGQGVADDVMETLETDNEEIDGDLTERYQDLFESDSSIVGQAVGYVRDKATGWLPELPSGGNCSPLEFTFQGHTLSIDCRVFDLIKAALSWILFFFTAYQITMIALSYRNGSEA